MGMMVGKVALVTGSGAGIGRAIARAFANEGASVMVSDIDSEASRETVEIIRSEGGAAEYTKADVTRPADVTHLVTQTVEQFGRLDLACNNAGIEGKIAALTDQDVENFDRVFTVNARGVFLCMQSEIRHMITHGGGAIVNLASVAGLVGFQGLSPYVASKHAVNGLTKTAALEYGKMGVRVNSVCPGVIETRMLDSLAERSGSAKNETLAMMDSLHPIGRIGQPQEVANLVVWLCSEKASFITGANVPVDGGFVAQ